MDGGDFEIGQQFLQQRAHVFAGWLVQCGQGLVEQQQAGPDSHTVSGALAGRLRPVPDRHRATAGLTSGC